MQITGLAEPPSEKEGVYELVWFSNRGLIYFSRFEGIQYPDDAVRAASRYMRGHGISRADLYLVSEDGERFLVYQFPKEAPRSRRMGK